MCFQTDTQDQFGQLPLPLNDKLVQHFPHVSRAKLELIVDNTEPRRSRSDKLQFELPFFEHNRVIERLAVRKSYRYLDYGVFDLFGHNQAMRKAALRLERLGVLTIGDLVSASRIHVFAAIKGDVVALKAIEEELSLYSLSLGMTLSRWSPRHAQSKLATR